MEIILLISLIESSNNQGMDSNGNYYHKCNLLIILVITIIFILTVLPSLWFHCNFCSLRFSCCWKLKYGSTSLILFYLDLVLVIILIFSNPRWQIATSYLISDSLSKLLLSTILGWWRRPYQQRAELLVDKSRDGFCTRGIYNKNSPR